MNTVKEICADATVNQVLGFTSSILFSGKLVACIIKKIKKTFTDKNINNQINKEDTKDTKDMKDMKDEKDEKDESNEDNGNNEKDENAIIDKNVNNETSLLYPPTSDFLEELDEYWQPFLSEMFISLLKYGFAVFYFAKKRKPIALKGKQTKVDIPELINIDMGIPFMKYDTKTRTYKFAWLDISPKLGFSTDIGSLSATLMAEMIHSTREGKGQVYFIVTNIPTWDGHLTSNIMTLKSSFKFNESIKKSIKLISKDKLIYTRELPKSFTDLKEMEDYLIQKGRTPIRRDEKYLNLYKPTKPNEEKDIVVDRDEDQDIRTITAGWGVKVTPLITEKSSGLCFFNFE